jgi:hemerythrin superfamily protein
MTTDSLVDDVVHLLEEDHRLVEHRFEEFDVAEPAMRRELFWKLTNELVLHEVAAEVVVYPAVRKLPGGGQIADARIAEQTAAEEQLAQIEKVDPESTEFVHALSTLKEVVLDHAQAEEKTAFLLLLGAVAPEERVELGLRYVKAKDAAPMHAQDTPAGNESFDPVAALVNRVRDAAGAVC